MYIRNSKVQKVKLLYNRDIKHLEKCIDDRIANSMQEVNDALETEIGLFKDNVNSNLKRLHDMTNQQLDIVNSLDILKDIFDSVIDYRIEELDTLITNVHENVKVNQREILDSIAAIAVGYYEATGEECFKTEFKKTARRIANKYKDAMTLVIAEQLDAMQECFDNFQVIYKHKLLDFVAKHEFEGVSCIDSEEKLFRIILNYQNEDGEESSNDFRDKPKSKNIYDFRALNKLAEEKGFTKVRQKGDHGIYKNKKGNTTVIPQGRDIGKGLSCKIQKEINY